MTTSPYPPITGCSNPDCTYSTCVNARAANKLMAAAQGLAEALRLALIDMESAPTLANAANRDIARAALAKAGVQS